MTSARPLTLETLAQRVEQLEGEMQALRAEIRPELELTLRQPFDTAQDRAQDRAQDTAAPLQRVPLVPEEQEVVDLLMMEGLIAPPTPRMLRAAAEWGARPAEEREAVARELRSPSTGSGQALWLDPPLSEIIIRMRRGENPASCRR